MRSDKSSAPLALKIAAAAVILFLNFPAAIIVLYAFTTESQLVTFPPPGLTLDWIGVALSRVDMLNSLWLSLGVAVASMTIAILLGVMVATAVSRPHLPGKDALSFLLVLPIALPGIVTGIALRSAIKGVLGLDLNFWTIVLGHATFCTVVVYNNVIARYRRLSRSQVEASMDLGASTFETFRYVVLPALATALLAGGMLAFALSFDEIIVTLFTAGTERTLPLWIYDELRKTRVRPVPNVVAVLVLAITFIPIVLAHRWTQEASSEQ